MNAKTCPTQNQLSEYVIGKLALDVHESVELHVDGCHGCQTAVASLDNNTVKLLAGVGAAKQRDDSPIRLLVEKAKAIAPGTISAHKGEMDRLAPGTVIGNYRIEELIGAGGMGKVYRAHHLRMKRDVAIKFLSGESFASAEAQQRFQREVEAAAKLTHPNIVAAYDADEVGEKFFLVMEHVPGRNLAEVIEQYGPLRVEVALRYALQAARGLQYAHDNGIVHRDIKPSNLLLDQKGNVKVLDLGLARSALSPDDKDNGHLTTSHQIMGTAAFMAPEQALNPRATDSRADIYSLGCTLYFLLTGKPVYDGATLMETVLAHRENSIPAVSRQVADCSPSLDGLLRRMLAKRPDDRPDSMSDVVAQIEELLAGDSSNHSSHRHWARRSYWMVQVGFALAASALLAFFWLNPWKYQSPLAENQVTPIAKGNNAKEIKPNGQIARDGNKGAKPSKKEIIRPPLPMTPVIQMASIKAGSFWMGTDDKNSPMDQRPRHKVNITRPFLLGKFEVTQEEFAEVMQVKHSESTPQFPIAGVTWLTAITFCNKASQRRGLTPYYEIKGENVRILGGDGYRLPTEAEWEYACRAGSDSKWHFGADAKKFGDHEWFAGNSKGAIQPVGKKLPNRWGLYDMHGNVSEWCWDRYDPKYYKDSAEFDPPGPSAGNSRVFRGGSFSSRIEQTTSAFRRPLSTVYGPISPDIIKLPGGSLVPVGSRGVGFRVARTVQ